MKDRSFYEELPAYTGTLESLLSNSLDSFQDLPGSWHIVVADIKGSTKAVMSGRFEDVNTIAASCVIACLNIARREKTEIPFFYGGDGATILVPDSLVKETISALSTLQTNVKTAYDLRLRVGSVSASLIHKTKSQLKIAKWAVSKGYRQAIILGNGLVEAEKYIKTKFNDESSDAGDFAYPVDLNGLTCRWKEIQPKTSEKEIVCLVVQVIKEKDQASIYSSILKQLTELYGERESRHPVHPSSLVSGVPFRRLRMKSLLATGSPSITELLSETIKAIGSAGVFLLRRKLFWFDPKKYIRELIASTNTIGLTGTLYTIISGTNKQRQALDVFLSELEAKGKIHYGLAICSSTIMTCYVQDLRTKHLHFVDGTSGGYTQAATQIKDKLRKKVEKEVD